MSTFLIDRFAESSRHAQRRMDEELKPIDDLLMRWGREARSTGIAIGWSRGTLLSRLIEQGPTGASQAGAPEAPVPRELLVIDYCVAHVRDIERQVLFEEYVHSPGMPKGVKVTRLRRRTGIRMSLTRWDNKLDAGRGAVLALFKTQI